jgi:hypothetical protein
MEVDFGKKPSALIPVVMSLFALLLVLLQVAFQFGTHAVEQTKPYEGAVAHLWQLLMAAQLPVIAFFGFRWLRRAPRQALTVLVVQGLALAAAAVIPVFVFGW